MVNSVSIAMYFLHKDSTLTDKQIQKLVYYAYCWYIVKKNYGKDEIKEKLFSECPEAWIHGPVFPELYKEMTYKRNDFLENKEYENFSLETKEFLDTIFEVYGKYSGNELENLTHNEKPWQEARKGIKDYMSSNKKIDDKIILDYYSN